MEKEYKGAPFETSESVISQTNKLLDSICDYNEETARALVELVEKMKDLGFQNPFKPVVSYGEKTALSADTKRDTLRQISKIRELYLLKKNTLRRAKVALAAHSIYSHCKKTGYLQEILEHLPLGGDYIARIAKYDIFTYDAYLEMMAFLGACSTLEESYSVIVKLKRYDEGKEVIESFRLINPNNIQERVRKIYGSSAEILATRIYTPEQRLLRGAEYRIALATALIGYASAEPSSQKHESPEVEAYNDILSKYGISRYYRIDLVENFDEVKEELVAASYGSYENGEFFLNDTLAHQLEAIRYSRSKSIFRKAKGILQIYLIEHLMSRQTFHFLPMFAKPGSLYAEAFKEFTFKGNRYNLEKPMNEFIELMNYDIMDNKELFAALLVKNNINPDVAESLTGLSSEAIKKSYEILKSIDLVALKKYYEID